MPRETATYLMLSNHLKSLRSGEARLISLTASTYGDPLLKGTSFAEPETMCSFPNPGVHPTNPSIFHEKGQKDGDGFQSIVWFQARGEWTFCSQPNMWIYPQVMNLHEHHGRNILKFQAFRDRAKLVWFGYDGMAGKPLATGNSWESMEICEII